MTSTVQQMTSTVKKKKIVRVGKESYEQRLFAENSLEFWVRQSDKMYHIRLSDDSFVSLGIPSSAGRPGQKRAKQFLNALQNIKFDSEERKAKEAALFKQYYDALNRIQQSPGKYQRKKRKARIGESESDVESDAESDVDLDSKSEEKEKSEGENEESKPSPKKKFRIGHDAMHSTVNRFSKNHFVITSSFITTIVSGEEDQKLDPDQYDQIIEAHAKAVAALTKSFLSADYAKANKPTSLPLPPLPIIPSPVSTMPESRLNLISESHPKSMPLNSKSPGPVPIIPESRLTSVPVPRPKPIQPLAAPRHPYMPTSTPHTVSATSFSSIVNPSPTLFSSKFPHSMQIKTK